MTALSRPALLLEQFAPRLAPLAQLALRFALAIPFFRSGLTRWDGFGQISDSTLYLFREVPPDLFGASTVSGCSAVRTWGTIAELVLVLLVLAWALESPPWDCWR
jgi:putative oxidoreductase